MKSRGKDPEGSSGATRVCTWCKEPFRNRDEEELHISLLGAPGHFHRVCFEEHRQAQAG